MIQVEVITSDDIILKNVNESQIRENKVFLVIYSHFHFYLNNRTYFLLYFFFNFLHVPTSMLKEVNFVHEHTRFSPVHARTVHTESTLEK